MIRIAIGCNYQKRRSQQLDRCVANLGYMKPSTRFAGGMGPPSFGVSMDVNSRAVMLALIILSIVFALGMGGHLLR
jgi:hypothetical protein